MLSFSAYHYVFMIKMCFVFAMAEFVMVKSVFAFSLVMHVQACYPQATPAHISLLVMFGEIAHYRVGVF